MHGILKLKIGKHAFYKESREVTGYLADTAKKFAEIRITEEIIQEKRILSTTI
jgi:hypothetical protein